MSIKTPIYLDYASTTPVDKRVVDSMVRYLDTQGIYGNPASRSHGFGWQAEEAVDIARNQIADCVNCDPREIVFTSGATESDNLAIKGAAIANADKGRHIITMATEHKAVLDTCKYMQQQGFDVTYLMPEKNGLLDISKLKSAIRQDTVLVSIMHVNNEIGVIQDIQSIGLLCRENNVIFHVDAAQSAGKLAIDLSTLPVDLMSFSAHKLYGPKGIGALYVRRKPKVELQAQIHGGGHERGMRSGTLATHQIVAMGKAFDIASSEMAIEQTRIFALRTKLWSGISKIEGAVLNGDLKQRISGNLNVSFEGVDGENLIMGLHDVAVSSGSACTSASLEPSYVLKAIGLSDTLAHSGLRFSIGRFTTQEQIDYVITRVTDVVNKLRETEVSIIN